MRNSTTTVYEGSKQCPNDGRLLTPLEVLYSQDGLCRTCHTNRVNNLVSRGMVED